MAQNLGRWLHGYVAEASADAEVSRFVARVDAAILAELPALAADTRLVEALHASTRAHWRVFLDLVERERPEVVVPPQAVDLALTIARRGMDIGVLLKVYRVAGRAVWTFLSDLVTELDSGDPAAIEVLMFLWDRASAWIDESIEHLTAIFHIERDRAMQGAMARRTQAVHAILDGSLSDVDLAAAELGYPLALHQTAFVLWLAEPDDADATHRAVTGFAEQLGGPRPLVLSVGAGDLWAWVATRRAPRLDRLTLTEPGVHACVGTPGRGLTGFRHGHADARRAQRLATGRPPGLTTYRDVELVALMAADPEAARGLVERELGALTAPTHAVLRQTLLLYLHHGGAIDRTAAALMVHKNTVRYRLHQVEDIIGHPLTDRRTHLDLALRYHAAFGP